MPADFETGFFGSTATGERWEAWHRLGTVIDRPVVNTAEAIELAGLDWQVNPVPAQVLMPDGTVATNPHFVAQVRTDTNRVLGFTTKEYETIQNAERFSFMDDLLASDEAKWHTAGVLREGRTVWMLAELTSDVVIAGIDTERLKMYLLLVDWTDGTGSMKVCPTPIRVVCTNTCNFALQTAAKMWQARHTAGIRDRMAEARRTLELTFAYTAELQEMADRLVHTPMGAAAFHGFLEQLVPMPAQAEETDRSWKSTLERRDAIQAVFEEAPNLEPVRGTAWAALQAVGEWNDWERGRKLRLDATPAKRRAWEESAWLRRVGPSTSIKDEAARILLAG